MTLNILSLDVMGGDNGPEVVLDGAERVLEKRPDLRFALYGDAAKVEPLLRNRARLVGASTFTHCEITVAMDDKPSQALRKGRYKSSMWRAVQAVRDGEAGACVSAGNTGALMVTAKFCLKTMAGIDRPAIAAIWPTVRGESIVLDVGATIGAEAEMLVDFAILGSAMARAVFALERPSVGLLNVGVEEIKGVEPVREAAATLREADLPGMSYHGFVEGSDIGRGTVDVVVTEGFAGNIALKTAEGTARQIAEYLREAMSQTMMSRAGYFLARDAFARMREKMNPSKVNGGVFLGLNGVVVKSHGGTDAEGFAAAIDLAADMAGFDLVTQIGRDLAFHHEPEESVGRAQAVSA